MPKTILIIEDEEILLGLLQKKLKQEGYNVLVAREGREGLSEMKKQKPDLVLLDIVMPIMDGFEVIKAMKADEEIKDIPVIIISNSGQPVELNKAKELGVKDWLIKTEFDPQEVVEKVKKQIGN